MTCFSFFKKENPEELLHLGYNYEFGIGVKKDEKKAFEYYMNAVEFGNPEAMNNVSHCYLYGIGVERNYQKAFEYCKKSADLGHAVGMCNVGRCYSNGLGVDQDYNKAFEYNEKAAKMGSKAAMSNVARYYRNGIGTKKDIESANYWFRRYKSLLETNESPDHINPELKKILDDERFKLAWIDYDEFSDIAELNKGGFSAVYVARWYDRINNLRRIGALKEIHDSNKNEQEFIQELKNYCEIGYVNPSFLECVGVSRNNYGDYIIVINYALIGSLRQNIAQISQLEWKDKLGLLYCIALDLESIHSQELVHRNLHSGNILQVFGLCDAYITDLGFSKKEKEGKVCGILPYIAPEVLVGQPYTKASDIYSLGVVATEISTGQRAFDGIPFDDNLVSKIIDGSRPKCLGPDCYIKLVMKCMDKDFDKRPTAKEISDLITHWLNEINQEDGNDIKKQFLKANKIKPEMIKPIHSQNVYTSKLYDTRNF